MELILIGLYVYFGAKANSFIKHNVFGIRTAYVFNLGNFIIEKIIMAIFLGWLTIPVSLGLKLFGVGRNKC